MASISLAEPISLGEGRSIRPPAGWTVSGRVADDPLRLQPGSRVLFIPPDNENATISWRFVDWLVGKPLFDDFRILLDVAASGKLEDMAVFYPALIRILPEYITQAGVVRLPGAGTVLALNYQATESGWAGRLIYAPSPEVEGEIQLLSYEGLELPYRKYLEVAMASLASFIDERLR